MANLLPHHIGEGQASGAQIIEGSLKFDKPNKQYLTFTPSSTGNRRAMTFSVWIKNVDPNTSNSDFLISAGNTPSGPRNNILYSPSKRYNVTQNPTGSSNDNTSTVGVFRDYSAWQHLVIALDCRYGQNSSQVKIYSNGELQENGDYAGGGSPVYITDQDTPWNTSGTRMYLGHYAANPADNAYYDGYLSQAYWIDGMALGPSYFGFTDPLTNTWRPKRFEAKGTTVNNGTVWSSGMTAAGSGGWKGSHGAATGFDEVSDDVPDLTTWPRSSAPSNNGLITFTPGTPIQYNNSIRAYNKTGSNTMYSATWSLNGGPATSVDTGSTDGWVTIATGSGKLTTLSTTRNGDGEFFATIEIDGVPLLDSRTQNLDYGTNGFYLSLIHI